MADCPGLKRRLESDHIILLIALLLNCEKAGIGGWGRQSQNDFNGQNASRQSNMAAYDC